MKTQTRHIKAGFQDNMDRLFKASKWLHKYLGLILIFFLIWMSASGMLMNHPDWISGLAVPGWLIPPQYHVKNWNRSSLIDFVFSKRNPEMGFFAGKQGIFKTTDGGKTFRPMMAGLPASLFYQKTRDLLLLEENALLFAATDGGLFVTDPGEVHWRQVPLGNGRDKVIKIIATREQLLAFTPSHVYAAARKESELSAFTQVQLERQQKEHKVSLVKLFFDLHDGKIWGIAGKLVFDATAILVIFLSFSAFYTWYFPWQRRRRKQSRLLLNPTSRRVFKTLFKYHLKIGIWLSAILLIIGGTGFFMRPPLLAALVGHEISASSYPGFLEDNPWLEKIQNALYDPLEDRIILQCNDGFWSGPADFSRAFQRFEFNAPVFVMGSTVFEPYGTGGFLVGSFNGIYHLERETNQSIDLLTNRAAEDVSSPVQPGEYMVTGYFRTPRGEEFITTHDQGLLPIGAIELAGRFEMPAELQQGFKMPLWNYLFEIHNGRFFKDLVGKWYIVILPIGSLLFVLITLTGIYDWLRQRFFWGKLNKEKRRNVRSTVAVDTIGVAGGRTRHAVLRH